VLTWDDALGKWVPGTVATDVPDEVWIGTMQPTGPDSELWFDPSDPGPASTGGADEVVVAAEDPYVTDPASTAELWYDSDAVAVAADEVYVGAADPRSDPLSGIELWFDTSADPPVLKFWSTDVNPPVWLVVDTSGAYLPLAGGNMASGAVIDFPNEADKAKIILYGDTTTGFGLGITSGTMNLFASSTIKFQANSITGAEWGNFTSAGLGPRTLVAGALQNNWTGNVKFVVNPAAVTVFIDASLPVTALGSLAYRFCGIPAGVTGPRNSITMWTKSMGDNYTPSKDVWVEVRADGIYAIFPGANDGTAKASPPLRIYTTMSWAR
jgi:hypothetical protein